MNKGSATIVLAIGLVVLVIGVVLVVLGIAARSEVITGMKDEEVTTEIDGKDVPVTSARAAMNQYDLIKSHTLGSFGSYSSLERDDPRRDTYLRGLTLRNSLVIGRMGLQISLLIIGLGALFILTGASLAITGVGSASGSAKAAA